jgi:glucan phosphoethanolaminetransferase (alkaline phosphatase superfamily)
MRMLRPATLFVVGTYLALSAVPFSAAFWGHGVPHPGRIAATELAAWLLVWALCKRPARFHWLLLPAFLALPVDLYLRRFYGEGISSHHLGILVETSPSEAIEFLGQRIWLLPAVLAATLGWWWLCWKAARSSRELDWTHRSRPYVLLIFALASGCWWYGREFGVATAVAASRSVPASAAASASASLRVPAAATGGSQMLPSWLEIPFQPEQFGATWPFGLSERFYEFWHERQYLSTLVARSARFSFGAHQTSMAPRAQIVVMVIGESSRYDRWSLNGYARDTTPLLKGQANLISFSDLVSPVAATRLSVPVIMSRKPATQSLQPGFSEKSFISAYREAGFKTWWLSNQMSFGKFDTPVSVYADEADVTRFLNPGGFRDNASYDEVLLPALQRAIDDPAPKKLIVLHSLGNHWNYSHRHPPQYNRWQPSLSGIDSPVPTNLKLKPLLNNSYDNSILYTDWFLSQVIAELTATQQLSTMMYVSDHGQTLYDGSCKLVFHGHNTQYEFHVPALLWYSDAWGAAYPAKLRQLRQHRDAPLATENIFHSLLDLADIRYPGERLEWSLFSSRWQPHKRYVDSYGWADYDHSSFKGDCREVIDKGTPLARK